MNELIGKKVLGLCVNEGESILLFQTDQGNVAYETDGDCCSETWFADITGVSALIGGTVKSAEIVDLPSVEDGRTRQEEDEFYGVKLVTDKGYVDIVYRNSSNGYYGGNISVCEWMNGQIFRGIHEDWTA